MRRQIRIAAVVLLALGACKKDAPAGEPYTLATARDAEQLKLVVTTGTGFHVNDEYPITYEVEGAPRLQLKDAVKKTACGAEAGHSCSAAVSVPNESGTFAFSVCSEEKCLIEKVKVAAVR